MAFGDALFTNREENINWCVTHHAGRLGNLRQQFELLKEKLLQEGLFEEERKSLCLPCPEK